MKKHTVLPMLLVALSITIVACKKKGVYLPPTGESFLDITFDDEVVDHDTPISQILQSPELHNPVTLGALSDWLFNQGRQEEAFFWFQVAQIRATYDYKRIGCTNKPMDTPTSGFFLYFVL